MKKIINYLTAMLCFLPCLFLFTACGNKSMVDTSGHYEETTKAEIVEFINNKNVDDIYSGYKMEVKQESKYKGQKVNTNISTIFVNGQMSMSTKINNKQQMAMYIKDNKVYLDSLGIKIQVDSTDVDINALLNGNNGNYINNQSNIKTLLDKIGNIAEQNKILFEKSQVENLVKYHISIDGPVLTQDIMGDMGKLIGNVQYGTYNLWVVFEGETITAIKASSSASASGVTFNTDIELIAYSSAIEFPSDLDEYKTNQVEK